ncbi:MAG: Cys-Gln thioester bond-forming surface protein [Oscillospiraceae bacterium]|nr:Cys-Gln thioester bond-forming surface protein [Oscillospiraceae bacterium]
MKRRAISVLLAVAMVLSMFTNVFANAAGTLDEAMASVNVFAKNDDLNWLRMNGSTKNQHYTYYNYESPQSGQMQEIPAYCVNPDLYGVPALVPEGTSIEYTCTSIVSDPKVCGIVGCGYPHMSLEALGLQTKEEAYYATKTALWCYLLSGKGWSINGLTVNPNADQAAAQRVLEATKNIYWYGMQWDEVLTPKLTATPDQEEAYKVEINGEQYYQQVYTVTSETWSVEEAAYVSLANPLSAPTGTKIVDLNNQEITQVPLSTEGAPDGASMWGQFKVIYPVPTINQNISFQINLNCTAVQYAIYYAECAVASEYGDIQDYMLDTDPRIPVEASVLSKATPDDPPPPPSETPPVETPPVETPPVETPPPPSGGDLRIVKREEGTRTPLAGAVFEVIGPKGDKIGSFTTDSKGVIELPVSEDGNYTVTELTPPKHHLLPDLKTQHVTVKQGETAELTFWNAPYGSLRIEKVSDTGEQLSGVTIQIKHIESGETQTGQTGPGGVIVFDELKPGAYEVRELAGKEGWQLDPENVQNVTVVTGKTSTATFVNKELPGLRIIKYNRKDSVLMSGVTFEIWRDGESLGRFQTDAMGEILLTNLKPGTYRAFEVDTGNEGMILDTTPQEVELHAGDGIKELTFFNDVKPGMHLIKVDSADPAKVIPGAKFRIEAVNGSYGPKEFTTGKDGTIDLSMLPAGSYVVTELECPGYVIDDAQRIIDLKPNDNAEFIFTNSKLPDLQLKKTSADGKPLAGVTFRLAKVEDGTHYLDATTDEKGEILWENLDPGVYSLKEIATVEDHILDPVERHVELFPGKVSTVTLKNNRRPNLIVYKRDADTGAPVPNTVFTVRAVDGHSVNDIKTDANGKVVLENLLPGVYEISEKSVPSSYLMDAPSQQVTLYPNKDREVYFENHKKPTLTVNKIDSITGEPIQGAKFQVWYGSNNTTTGELNDLGTYFSDAKGQFRLELLRDGWYKVTELEPAAGYNIKEPATQEVYIKGGENKELTFENNPLSALIVWKYDSVTGEAIEGAVFQVKYLGGTSGTGGTVIGTYRTGHNGSFSVTGLKEGNYTVEELSSDGDHVIDTPPQTAYISGKEQDVVELYFGNSPKGSLLVKKVDASNGKPLSDVEFLVTDSSGTVVGDANGKFVTDSSGSFLVEGINPGMTLIVKETRAKEGYVLDDVPQTIAIRAGKTAVLEFRNQPTSSLLIIKKDAVNGKPISGVEFLVTDSGGNVLGSSNGKFVTDSAGTIRVDGLTPGMTVIAKETRAKEGYVLDDTPQTVKIKANEVATLEFRNQPTSSLLIMKKDAATGKPLAGVEFLVTDSSGGVLGSANGKFVTDSAGTIRVDGLTPGMTVIAKETRAKEGYLLDDAPQTAKIKANEVVTLEFLNQPAGSLVIVKRDSLTGKPLEGVTFKVTTSTGEFVPDEDGQLSSNGLYWTDKEGKIIINGVVGSLVVTETKSIPGYTIDPSTQTQTVVVRPNDTQTLHFYNTPSTTLVIEKYISGTEHEPLKGVTFLVTDSSGAVVGQSNGEYVTDESGRIVITDLEPGTTVTARETKTVDGYVLDGAPKSILIKEGEVQTMRFYNQKKGTLVVKKLDKLTGQPLAGVEFKITYSEGGFVDADNGHLSSKGIYWTDKNGEIRLPLVGTVVVEEVKSIPNYVIDQANKTQTVTVNPADTQSIYFYNEPMCSLTLTKLDKVTGKPVPGTEFTVKDGNGNILGRYTTGKDGTVVVSGLAPNSTVVVSESKVPTGYVLDTTPQTIIVKNGNGNSLVSGGNSSSGGNNSGGNDLTFENDPTVNLTIHKARFVP